MELSRFALGLEDVDGIAWTEQRPEAFGSVHQIGEPVPAGLPTRCRALGSLFEVQLAL
jgi:hypothetical protein